MELANIEHILEAYFEGNTTLAQEHTLRAYFTGADVAAHLEVYVPLFSSLEKASKEISRSRVVLPESKETSKRWWLGIAASVGIVLAVASFVFKQDHLTIEEKEAIAAFKKSREALLFMSKHLNKGTEDIAFLNEFTKTKNKVFKEN